MLYNNSMKKLFSVVLILVLSLALLCAFTACKKAKPTKLTVTKTPDTVKVVQGQDADFSGGLVEVEYDDGSVKELSMSDMSVKGLNNEVLGTQTVALSYTENGKTVSATIDLTVVAPKVTALTLQTDGVKVSYVEGEIFNKEGLVVTATYQTGTEGTVKSYEIAPQTLSVDTTAVKITYRGVTAEIPVTVAARAPVSMEFTSQPAKKSYFIGELFDSTGIAALVKHNDGTTETFNNSQLSYYHNFGSNMTYTGPFTEEDNVVKVVARSKYGNISNTITLTVTAVRPVSLAVTINKPLVFVRGDYFSFDEENEAVSAIVSYNDGSEQTFVGSFDFFACEMEELTIEQTSVTIWVEGYPDVTAEVAITVTEPSLTSIVVKNNPVNTIYAVGDDIDLSGMILRLIYSNGDDSDLVYSAGAGITASPAVVTAGVTTIEVGYQGFAATFNILIAEP